MRYTARLCQSYEVLSEKQRSDSTGIWSGAIFQVSSEYLYGIVDLAFTVKTFTAPQQCSPLPKCCRIVL